MAAALYVASTAGSVPLCVESIARSVMNFDALLGDELMLARVAVRYHVVHAAHAVSCVCVQWRVLQARVLLHFRLWLLAAESHRMYMCFVAVSVSARMLSLCAVMTAQC